MNPDVLDYLAMLRERLDSRRLELQAEIASTKELLPIRNSTGSSEVTDTKDRAGRLQMSEVIEADEQRDLAEVRQIDKAIQRMNSGNYGTCEQCGSAIPLQRLLVQPAAERCLGCQEDLETKCHTSR